MTDFEAMVDKAGRIEHFMPRSSPDTVIYPENMAAYVNGNERIRLGENEYLLTANGSLVHPEVEVIETVSLGSGVRLDQGTTFRNFNSSPPDSTNRIEVGDRTRVSGTKLKEGVIVGRHALILAQEIGPKAVIGDEARVAQGVKIFQAVVGRGARIDRDCWIDAEVTIGEGARLGYKTIVCESATIGHHAKIGKFTGSEARGINQDGVLIRHGKSVEAYDEIVR